MKTREEVKVTRDNVREIARTFKTASAALMDILNELEAIHTGYAVKKGKTKRTRRFSTVRTALNGLVSAIRSDGF